MHHARRCPWSNLFAAVMLIPLMLGAPPPVRAQGQRIEPREVAVRPADLPPRFTVVDEETRAMDPGPGVFYRVNLERPIDEESVTSGPVGVTQVIGRFDQSISYEGFLDELRQLSIAEDGFELVPGAPNDGGTASLQKFEGDVAAFRVGFIKRDMVIFTGWIGRRGVVSLEGLLTLAGVSSHRYDEALMARTGVPVPRADGGAPGTEEATSSRPPSGGSSPVQQGRVTDTGGSGANVRALPHVNSELLTVIYDDEIVELIGAEEKGEDGRGWRNVRTSSGIVGWVVGEYVTAGSPTVAAAPAPPPPPSPTPTPPPPARTPPTPTAPTGGTVDSRLVPALRSLFGIRQGPRGGVPWGEWYRAVVDQSQINIVVRPLPDGIGGTYAFRTNTVTIAQAALSEDVRIIATILAHELTHVAQSLLGPDAAGSCVDREVQAMQNEMIVMMILYEGPAPGRTAWEREENARVLLWLDQGDPILYKLVVDAPGYQEQCKLWIP